MNRQSLKEKLLKQDGVNILIEAENGEVFYKKMLENKSDNVIDVVLLDLDMPVMNGIETIALCKFVFPHLKFIILTIFEDLDKIFEAICIGAHGYLLKEDNGLNIEEAIRNAHLYNAMPMSPTIARKSIELIKLNSVNKEEIIPMPKLIITEREMEILKLLTTGISYPKIGEMLFISPLTVRKHVANIYEKLHVNSRSQLILKAQAHKLI